MSHKPNYILDLLVHEATLSPDLKSLKTPVFCMFRMDGMLNPFQSDMVDPGPKAVFNYPARAFLEIMDLSRAYLYVNFCTIDAETRKVHSLGVSKVCMKSLPVGNPRKFQFPLMSSTNTAITIAKLSMTATLSELVVQPAYFSNPERSPYVPLPNMGTPFNSVPQSYAPIYPRKF